MRTVGTYVDLRSWWEKTTSLTLWPWQRRLCCVGAMSSCDEASQKAVAYIFRGITKEKKKNGH